MGVSSEDPRVPVIDKAAELLLTKSHIDYRQVPYIFNYRISEMNDKNYTIFAHTNRDKVRTV